MKDIQLKLGLAKLFWAWDYAPQLGVRLIHPEALSPKQYELTDVDVYGIRATSDFSMDRLLGDCTTSKVSPISRTFWLKGVMDFLGAQRGYLLVKPRKPIVEDHKLSAYSMGITLMSEQEFMLFQSKLLPRNFPQKMRLFEQESWRYYEENVSKIKFLERLNEYRKYRFWIDPPSRALRHSLMETRRLREEIDPRQKPQKALVLDMTTLFSVALLDMLCTLFHLYLIPEHKADIDDYLKTYVYGGREYYDHLNRLARLIQEYRQQQVPMFADREGGAQSISDLSLPEWDRFLQLFRTILEHPSQFRNSIRFLRFVLFERLLYDNQAVSIGQAIPDITTHTIKLSIDVVDYFLRACSLHDKLWTPISDLILPLLLQVQGEEPEGKPELVPKIKTVTEARTSEENNRESRRKNRVEET